MANPGSIDSAFRKSSAASEYSKLWSCARPWRNAAWAAGAPELVKATSPTCAKAKLPMKAAARKRARFRISASGDVSCAGLRSGAHLVGAPVLDGLLDLVAALNLLVENAPGEGGKLFVAGET